MHTATKLCNLILAVFVTALVSNSAMAEIYDLAKDYSNSSNPAGVWSYGAKTNSSSAFVFGTPKTTANIKMWEGTGMSYEPPVVWRNDLPVAAGQNLPGVVALHGGANGELAVARFTAPKSCVYNVRILFGAGDSGETKGKIWKNTSLLFESTTSSNPSFIEWVMLNAGDTLDVTVEKSGASHSFGTTPVKMTVSDTTQMEIPAEYSWKFGVYGFGAGQIYVPSGVALDASGNIYVSDTGNACISKFSPSGQFILKFGTSGFENGQFSEPRGIAIDPSGNIYVADMRNHRVQKFTSSGVWLSTFGTLGSGDGQFNFPTGLAFDSSGNLYVADSSNGRIQKFSQSGSFLGKFGTPGTGNGQLGTPYGLTFDASGNIYVVEQSNSRVSKFSSSGVFISKFGGTYGGREGEFNWPLDIDIDASGCIYVLDAYNCRIQKFTSSGAFLSTFGQYSGNGGNNSPNGVFNYPYNMAINSAGDLYITDFNNSRVQIFKTFTEVARPRYLPITNAPTMGVPASVEMAPDGAFYVTMVEDNFIARHTVDPRFVSNGFGLDTLSSPYDTAVDASGNVLVADYRNHVIRKFSPGGTSLLSSFGGLGSAAGSLSYPAGVYVHSDGSILVTEHGNHRVQRFTAAGETSGTFSFESLTNGVFSQPHAVCADSSGNVYVTDISQNRVVKFASDGTLLTSWGTAGSASGQFNVPNGISITADGYVAVSDRYNHRIQLFTTSGGYIATIGGGTTGGGAYQFQQPGQISVASNGNLLVPHQSGIRFSIWAAVDTTNPSLTISVSPAANATGWRKGPVTVTLSAIDANPQKIMYSQNSGEYTSATGSSYSYTVSSSGSHTVSAYAVDQWANQSTTASATFSVDGTAPSATLTRPTGNTVLVTATDSESGVASIYISVDGAPEVLQSGATTITSGTHTVSWRVLDNVGNVTTSSQFVGTQQSVSGVTLTPSAVGAGETSTGTVTLSGPAPPDGQVVTLSASNGYASVPATVTVAAGATTATFTVSTASVPQSTSSVITATSSETSKTATLTIYPARVVGMSLSSSSVTGGTTVTATVTLGAAAGTGGALVSLGSSDQVVAMPSNVRVPEGQTSVSFSIPTYGVGYGSTVVSLLAFGGAQTVEKRLTITSQPGAPTLQSFAFNPPSVVGGTTVTATFTLSGPAPSNGVMIRMYGTEAQTIRMPSSVLVPAGSRTVTISVPTVAVSTLTLVSIDAFTTSSPSDYKKATLRIARPNGR